MASRASPFSKALSAAWSRSRAEGDLEEEEEDDEEEEEVVEVKEVLGDEPGKVGREDMTEFIKEGKKLEREDIL